VAVGCGAFLLFHFLKCIYFLILKLRNAMELVGAIMGIEHFRGTATVLPATWFLVP
jgi:hypothetical protein